MLCEFVDFVPVKYKSVFGDGPKEFLFSFSIGGTSCPGDSFF
jgi:hypothetical protein